MPIGLSRPSERSAVSQLQPNSMQAAPTGQRMSPPVAQEGLANTGTSSSFVFAEAADKASSSGPKSGLPEGGTNKGPVAAAPADWFIGLMNHPSTQLHEGQSGMLKYSFSTTELGKSQLFTDGKSNAKTLVISAHGSYARKSGSIQVPANTRFEMLNPHGTYLADPRIGNIVSGGRKIYATLDQDGVQPETVEAKKLLDEKGFKAITGSHKQGMIRNYDLSPYEDDNFDVVGQAIDSNRLYAAGGVGTKADFLILKEKASLEEVIDELKAKGIHYENIDLGFCRGSDSLFKRGHTFDPKNATRLAEPNKNTAALASSSCLPDHHIKHAPMAIGQENVNRPRAEGHAHSIGRQHGAMGLSSKDTHLLASEPSGQLAYLDRKSHFSAGSDRNGRLKEIEVTRLEDLATLSLSHRDSPVPDDIVVCIRGEAASKAQYLTADQRKRFEALIHKALCDEFGREEVEAVRAAQHEHDSVEKLKKYSDFIRKLPLERLIPARNMENHLFLASRKIEEGETTREEYARENNIDPIYFGELLTKSGKLTAKGERQIVFGAIDRARSMPRDEVLKESNLQEPLSTELRQRMISDLLSDIANHGVRLDVREMESLFDDQLRSLYEHMDWHDRHFASGADTSALLKGFLNKVYGIQTFSPHPVPESARRDAGDADRRNLKGQEISAQLDRSIAQMAAEEAKQEQNRRKNDLEHELDAKRRAAITAAPERSGSKVFQPAPDLIVTKGNTRGSQRSRAPAAGTLESNVPAVEWPSGGSGRAGIEEAYEPAPRAPERNPFEGRFSHLDPKSQRALYRQLALENHPDKLGGDTGMMQLLNAAFAAAKAV